MEMQRQRERLKLIEIEKRKKEKYNKENLNNSKLSGPSSLSNSKRVNILSPINNSDNSQLIENKKSKRKIKFRPKIIPEASKELDLSEKLKKSLSLMSNKEQESSRNQVKSKSPLNSPKDQGSKDDKNLAKKGEIPMKLKRQITNFNRIQDRYEILKTLGDGNFAVVKHAKLKNTENEYAIKIIDKSKMRVKLNQRIN